MDQASVAAAFAAIGSVPRLDVLTCLVRAGDGGLLFKDIQERTGLPASTLSHHVKTLAAVGLVEQERQGRETVSWARIERLEALSTYIVEQCCADHGLSRAAPVSSDRQIKVSSDRQIKVSSDRQIKETV